MSDEEIEIVESEEVVERVEEIRSQMTDRVWQDVRGKPFGHTRGLLTYFRKCVLTTAKDVNFRPRVADIKPSEVMLKGGLQVLNKVPIEFVFVQREGPAFKYPTIVGWRGPTAVLDFVDKEGVVVHTDELSDSPHRVFQNLVDATFCKPFRKICVSIAEGADTCEIVFSYNKIHAARKLSGLAGDMEADEAHKDVTIECADNKQVKVHKAVLQAYSKQCGNRFDRPEWGYVMVQTEDSAEAWTLLVATLYGHDDAGFGCEHMMEAMKIAFYQGFLGFVERGFALGIKVIDEGSVLSLLALAWPMRTESKGAALCVTKCLELFAPNMLGMGPAWLMEYAAFKDANPEFNAHVLAFEMPSSKKRGRNGNLIHAYGGGSPKSAAGRRT